MVALPLLAALALSAPAETAVVSESRPTMGTLVTVTVAGVPPARANVAIEAAFAIFERVDWSMNEWREDSPLSLLNRRAGKGWVALPGDLCDVLARAQAGAAATGGLFDVTWAALSDLWRFDGSATAPPPDAALEALCPLVGWRGLALRPRTLGCEARLARAGMKIGLGGIAKGWALDAAARALRALGQDDFLLQAGGDLYAAGRRGGARGAPWRVAIRDPRGGPTDALAALDVSDRAFSTTGDYEHAYEAGGRRYHHVIDPRTCRPSKASRGVTILALTAVDAEILGKAVFLEGGQAGLARAEARGAAAVIVTGDGAVLASEALSDRLLRAGRQPVRGARESSPVEHPVAADAASRADQNSATSRAAHPRSAASSPTNAPSLSQARPGASQRTPKPAAIPASALPNDRATSAE